MQFKSVSNEWQLAIKKTFFMEDYALPWKFKELNNSDKSGIIKVIKFIATESKSVTQMPFIIIINLTTNVSIRITGNNTKNILIRFIF